MRLGFKHFDIGKRKFCITTYRFLYFCKGYIKRKAGINKEISFIDTFHFNLLPVIRYEYSWSTKTLSLEWLFWVLQIEDETYQNMGSLLED